MRGSIRRAARRPSAYIAVGVLAGIALGLSVQVGGWSIPGGGGPAPDDDIAGPARVIDGDTIVIQGTHIRLSGIDAPESRQSCTDAHGNAWACGAAATQALAGQIGWQAVHCTPHGLDVYGRTLGTCRIGEINLNRWMVRAGMAVAYTHYSWTYFPAQIRARAAAAGIWAGDFEQPWRWRQEHRGERR